VVLLNGNYYACFFTPLPYQVKNEVCLEVNWKKTYSLIIALLLLFVSSFGTCVYECIRPHI